MEESENKNAPVQHSSDVVEIGAVGEMIRSAVEPLARSQEIAAKEATNQARIIAETYAKFGKYIFLFGVGILLVVVIALFQDKEDTALQIMMGLFGLIGGLGINKMLKKS